MSHLDRYIESFNAATRESTEKARTGHQARIEGDEARKARLAVFHELAQRLHSEFIVPMVKHARDNFSYPGGFVVGDEGVYSAAAYFTADAEYPDVARIYISVMSDENVENLFVVSVLRLVTPCPLRSRNERLGPIPLGQVNVEEVAAWVADELAHSVNNYLAERADPIC